MLISFLCPSQPISQIYTEQDTDSVWMSLETLTFTTTRFGWTPDLSLSKTKKSAFLLDVK